MTLSRPYKAYDTLAQKYQTSQDCKKSLDNRPEFKGRSTDICLGPVDYAPGYTPPPSPPADCESYRKLLRECETVGVKKTTTGIDVLPDFSTGVDIPLPWLVAGGLGLVVLILLVTRK